MYNRIYHRNYYLNNKEHMKNTHKNWSSRNSNYYRDYFRKYRKNKEVREHQHELWHIRYIKKQHLGRTFDTSNINPFMLEALAEAYKGINKGHGGPFGCVIVKGGKVIGRGHNRVLKNNDPTAHGEIEAIRNACKRLKTFNLKGCVMYTTGQCCTMCLVASMWANISKIYYSCTIEDNAMIGFRDESIDKTFQGREKLKGFEEQLNHEAGLKLFKDYLKRNHKLY